MSNEQNKIIHNKFKLTNVTLLYPHLFTLNIYNDKASYNTKLLISHSDSKNLNIFKSARSSLLLEKKLSLSSFKDEEKGILDVHNIEYIKKCIGTDDEPLSDIEKEDNLKKYSMFKDMFRISAKVPQWGEKDENNFKSCKIYGANGKITNDESLFYSGTIVNVILGLYVSNTTPKKICCNLLGVQFASHGEPLTKSSLQVTDNDFDVLEEDIQDSSDFSEIPF